MSQNATETGGAAPTIPIGLPRLSKLAFDGADLAGVWNSLVGRVKDDPRDAAALLDLSTIAHLQGRPADRAALQTWALGLQQVYRQPPAAAASQALRVLAFMAAGDFMANMPIGFLLEASDVTLDMVYLAPELPFPASLPEHDLAFVAVAESSENQALLDQLAEHLRAWPRPVINRAEQVARLTRDGAWALLRQAPGVEIPISTRIDRHGLERIGRNEAAVEDALEGRSFPVILRPVDSHAGDGLSKLDCATAIADYLVERDEPEFYLSPFVDYQGRDGLFRKYRIALIDGRPYAVHMAISEHWMIHYLNADMTFSAERRAEEARFMAGFEEDFAARHAKALDAIGALVGLDYVPLDCGETRDGKLLLFEIGTNMVVHAMDSPELFPYKRPQMEKVFGAFRSMLRARAA
jgi:hypothetical protein